MSHTMTQSLVIIDFLDSMFGGQAGKPTLVPPADGTPEGSLLRARALEIAEVINSGIQPLQNLSVLKQVRSAVGAAGQEMDGRGFASEKIVSGLEACEKLVASANGRFAAGDVLTVADVCLIPALYNARRF